MRRMTELTYSNVEFEILAAGAALWHAGVNGRAYKGFLSAGDHDRLLAEFGEPAKLLTFTRFTVEIQEEPTDTSFVSGNADWTYLDPPHRLGHLENRPYVR